MKKILLFTLFLFSLTAYADQWYVLSYDQATQAKEFLDKQSYVVSFCGCCDNDPKQLIEIKKVQIEKWKSSNKDENLYYIKIDGTNNSTNQPFSEGVDLAYIHVLNSDGLAFTVAGELSWEVDACVEPFPFDVKKEKKKNKRNRKLTYHRFLNSINENDMTFLTKISSRFN